LQTLEFWPCLVGVGLNVKESFMANENPNRHEAIPLCVDSIERTLMPKGKGTTPAQRLGKGQTWGGKKPGESWNGGWLRLLVPKKNRVVTSTGPRGFAGKSPGVGQNAFAKKGDR